MDGHDAVLSFAPRAAPLPLDSRRLVSLLVITGLVDDPDGLRMGMLPNDDLGHALAHLLLIPRQQAQKVLQRPRRHARLQGDRLDALAFDVRELPLNVGRQVLARVTAGETVGEHRQKTAQLRFQTANLAGIHARASLSGWQAGRFANSTSSGKTNLAL